MPRGRPQLAKLTRPRLHGAVARERLFEVVDAARERPILWVFGPPGAGKTTLVASYLEHAALPAIWYQLDGADSDPATFFYYLAVAIAPPARARPLPLLTPEYLPDLEGFSRRFFRDAFAGLAQGSLLVLDNYHEIAVDSPLHRALNAAFTEVPQSANVVVISRIQPPTVFARLQVADILTTVGWEALRLTEEETAAIVARRQDLPVPLVAASIHARAGGWAAGVRLLLERVEAGSAIATLDRPEAVEVAFDYLAAEIFERAPEALRQVLLKTAFLPRFTGPLAGAITGDPQAGHRVEELYRRRLFIDRRMGNEVTYQYHDLFRAFLRARAEQTFPPEEVAALSGTAAELLLAARFFEDAFDLFVHAQHWERAEQVFLDNAPGMIAQGRWRTLENWSVALPEERLRGNPWVRYWLGRSKTFVDPGAARLLQESAYRSFLDSSDDIGQLLSCAAVTEALHFEIQDFKAYEYWLELLTRLLQLQRPPLRLDDELWVHATLMLASTLSSPGNPMLPSSIAKVEELLPLCTDVNLKVIAANMLHYSGAVLLDPEAVAIATVAGRPVLRAHGLSADRLALYYFAEGYSHYIFGRDREALACFDSADEAIEQHGLAGRVLFAGIWRGLCQRATGRLQEAEATIARSEKARAGDHGFASFMLDHVKALVAFDRGNMDGAITLGLAALRRAEEIGNQVGLLINRLDNASMLIQVGRVQQAREILAAAESQQEMIVFAHVGGRLALLEAWAAHKMRNQPQCDAYLNKAMALFRSERGKVPVGLYRWYAKAMMEVLPLALERGVETELARTLVRECNLSPPPSLPEAWPWPVRIYTLGRFEVLVDDKPLVFGRKAPKRTLALLKAIIALGGRDVGEQRLCDALWPDLEGDAACEALAAALHRLRRLLRVDEAIRQIEGTLSLNEQRCFVDAWTFEAGVEQRAQEQMALQLYHGRFLQGEAEAPWSASMRERLRGKFVRTLQAAGRELEGAGRYEEAVDLYSRGIEADEFIEPFYQGLMRSYQRLGRTTEAASAYRRLRRTLSVTLGVQPGLDTQRLFDELRLP